MLALLTLLLQNQGNVVVGPADCCCQDRTCARCIGTVPDTVVVAFTGIEPYTAPFDPGEFDCPGCTSLNGSYILSHPGPPFTGETGCTWVGEFDGPCGFIFSIRVTFSAGLVGIDIGLGPPGSPAGTAGWQKIFGPDYDCTAPFTEGGGNFGLAASCSNLACYFCNAIAVLSFT